MTKVMILSLKERFLQSIVAMILFIKEKTHIHTMTIYIACKKTNWCTFGRFYPYSYTFWNTPYGAAPHGAESSHLSAIKIKELSIKPSSFYVIRITLPQELRQSTSSLRRAYRRTYTYRCPSSWSANSRPRGRWMYRRHCSRVL